MPGLFWVGSFYMKHICNLVKQTAPSSCELGAVCLNKSLTMTYFHTGTRTIIGAKAFHCPVRDGKEWYHLAMVIRLNWLAGCCTVINESLVVQAAYPIWKCV